MLSPRSAESRLTRVGCPDYTKIQSLFRLGWLRRFWRADECLVHSPQLGQGHLAKQNFEDKSVSGADVRPQTKK